MTDRDHVASWIQLLDKGSVVAAPAELAALYNRAFEEFKAEALWNVRQVENPTVAAALLVADRMRREGTMRVMPLVAKMLELGRAAL